MVQKTALVTGAASGIGKACAIRLAKEGVSVGVLDLDGAKCEEVVAEITNAGGKAIALSASIADRQQVRAAVNQLREAFGPVNVVVNNAGISNFIPFEELGDDDWEKMFTINAQGTFIVTQEVLADMKACQWGRVVNISSSSAQTGSAAQVHYSASKGAVIAMTKSLAQALGGYGITVNNIPPGAIANTIMFEKNKTDFKMSMDQLVAMTPVGRTGTPEDIAGACAWLVSEESGYVTGQTIGVNGGRVIS